MNRLRFEEQIISVNGFFKIHGISMSLRDRITEHFKLRYQFNRGVLLPRGVRHWLYDAPPYISDDSLYAELSVQLEGVPIFSVKSFPLYHRHLFCHFDYHSTQIPRI